MTTLELYRKHKKGEIGRDRFLYEVRKDNNLPWITNITSYDDAVKILKNKGIIRESVQTDPVVDNVNPYALKRAVHKILEKEKNLTNNSYVEALNKAAKKLKDPAAVKAEMFANAESVAKADAKLQTQEVKKANHKDKHNEMKKAKGQQTPKATAAPTKENKKTKKPKGVKVMPDKGVEGSQKIIKEISNFIKKKLTENNTFNEFHEGMQVETQYGPAVVKEIKGGTLEVQTKDGKLYDVQMNHVKHFADKKSQELPKQEAIDVRGIGGHEGGMKLADKLIDAINAYNALDPDQKQAEIDRLKADIPAELKAKFDELMNALHDESNYPAQEEDPNLKEYVSSDFVGNWSTITVSLRDAARAIELFRDASFDNYLKTGVIKMDGTNSYIVTEPEVAQDLFDLFQENGVEIMKTHFPPNEEDDLDEARDINDPSLVALRSRIQKKRMQQNLKQSLGTKDRDLEILRQIKALKMDRAQAMRDMEQEAEPEGGPIADDYADRLMDLDKQIKSLEAQLYEEDLDEDLEEKIAKVVDINTGGTIELFSNPSKAQQYVNSKSGDVRSQIKVQQS